MTQQCQPNWLPTNRHLAGQQTILAQQQPQWQQCNSTTTTRTGTTEQQNNGLATWPAIINLEEQSKSNNGTREQHKKQPAATGE
jgi:hypothetical protein